MQNFINNLFGKKIMLQIIIDETQVKLDERLAQQYAKEINLIKRYEFDHPLASVLKIIVRNSGDSLAYDYQFGIKGKDGFQPIDDPREIDISIYRQ